VPAKSTVASRLVRSIVISTLMIGVGRILILIGIGKTFEDTPHAFDGIKIHRNVFPHWRSTWIILHELILLRRMS